MVGVRDMERKEEEVDRSQQSDERTNERTLPSLSVCQSQSKKQTRGTTDSLWRTNMNNCTAKLVVQARRGSVNFFTTRLWHETLVCSAPPRPRRTHLPGSDGYSMIAWLCSPRIQARDSFRARNKQSSRKWSCNKGGKSDVRQSVTIFSAGWPYSRFRGRSRGWQLSVFGAVQIWNWNTWKHKMRHQEMDNDWPNPPPERPPSATREMILFERAFVFHLNLTAVCKGLKLKLKLSSDAVSTSRVDCDGKWGQQQNHSTSPPPVWCCLQLLPFACHGHWNVRPWFVDK